MERTPHTVPRGRIFPPTLDEYSTDRTGFQKPRLLQCSLRESSKCWGWKHAQAGKNAEEQSLEGKGHAAGEAALVLREDDNRTIAQEVGLVSLRH